MGVPERIAFLLDRKLVFCQLDLLRAAKVSAARAGKKKYEVFAALRAYLASTSLRPSGRGATSAKSRRSNSPIARFTRCAANRPGIRYAGVLVNDPPDADLMVSGDRHLTELRNPRPPVLSPREFLEQLTPLS